MPHHAEDMLDAPVDHGLGHHVAGCAHMRRLFQDRHVDAIVAHLGGERFDAVVVSARRLAAQRVEVPAVPGAAQVAVLDRAFAERPALVRALVVQGGVLAFVVRQAHGAHTTGHTLHAAVGELAVISGLVPDEVSGGLFRLRARRRLALCRHAFLLVVRRSRSGCIVVHLRGPAAPLWNSSYRLSMWIR